LPPLGPPGRVLIPESGAPLLVLPALAGPLDVVVLVASVLVEGVEVEVVFSAAFGPLAGVELVDSSSLPQATNVRATRNKAIMLAFLDMPE
jgi:hypothetical protein